MLLGLLLLCPSPREGRLVSLFFLLFSLSDSLDETPRKVGQLWLWVPRSGAKAGHAAWRPRAQNLLGPCQWLCWANTAHPMREAVTSQSTWNGPLCAAEKTAPKRRHGLSKVTQRWCRSWDPTQLSGLALVGDTWPMGQQQVKAGANPLTHVLTV